MALTRALLPLMEEQPDARVVTVTSGAQYFGRIAWEDPNGEQRYDRWQAYGQREVANVMFALELDRQLRDRGSSIRSLAAHPGLALTNLQPASVSANGSRLEALAYRLMDPLFQSAAMGALPQRGGGHGRISPKRGALRPKPPWRFAGLPQTPTCGSRRRRPPATGAVVGPQPQADRNRPGTSLDHFRSDTTDGHPSHLSQCATTAAAGRTRALRR
jgi:hypothetical protein